MATNKGAERYSSFGLLMPANTAIASGQPLLFGRTYVSAVVATEAQTASLTTGPAYDNNTGYINCDFEGLYFLTVVAETLGSVSAGAAFNNGDMVFASGGTYDPVSGITYGVTLCNDPNGDPFGQIMQPLAAGTTAVVAVLLKNAFTKKG